ITDATSVTYLSVTLLRKKLVNASALNATTRPISTACERMSSDQLGASSSSSGKSNPPPGGAPPGGWAATTQLLITTTARRIRKDRQRAARARAIISIAAGEP